MTPHNHIIQDERGKVADIATGLPERSFENPTIMVLGSRLRYKSKRCRTVCRTRKKSHFHFMRLQEYNVVSKLRLEKQRSNYGYGGGRPSDIWPYNCLVQLQCRVKHPKKYSKKKIFQERSHKQWQQLFSNRASEAMPDRKHQMQEDTKISMVHEISLSMN